MSMSVARMVARFRAGRSAKNPVRGTETFRGTSASLKAGQIGCVPGGSRPFLAATDPSVGPPTRPAARARAQEPTRPRCLRATGPRSMPSRSTSRPARLMAGAAHEVAGYSSDHEPAAARRDRGGSSRLHPDRAGRPVRRGQRPEVAASTRPGRSLSRRPARGATSRRGGRGRPGPASAGRRP